MYQTDQIHAFLKEHLDWINKTYKENKKRQDSGDKRIIQDALLGNLIDLRRLVRTFAKQDSFYQEKECRIVLWKDFTKEPLKTFANKPRLPVMKLEHKDMIASITVSPQGNQKRNQKLAEILCVKLGISPKIIKLSKSSFIGK